MKKILKNKKGFTLIELIVVIAIIAILAAIAVPTFIGVMDDAKKADTISMARNAYSLAKIDLLNDEIDGDTLAIDEADIDQIMSDAGMDSSTDTLEVAYSADSLVVTVTSNGWVAKNDNGTVTVVVAAAE